MFVRALRMLFSRNDDDDDDDDDDDGGVYDNVVSGSSGDGYTACYGRVYIFVRSVVAFGIFFDVLFASDLHS